MALIDPKGLFYGERLGDCSDEAQLHWPRLFAASNGFGRIELSYERLCGTVYQSFKKRPTPAQLSAWFNDYQKNWLLFIYRAADGSMWGQWITSEKFLPKFKTQADRNSPSPNPEALDRYRKTYIESRRAKYLSFESFHKSSEEFENVPNSSEDFHLGEGVGEGVGEGIKQKPAPPATELPEWVGRESWDGFREMRRKIRAPLTARAEQQILGKLEGLRCRGHDPNACLDQSTERGWRGVFEVHGGGSGSSNGARSKPQEPCQVSKTDFDPELAAWFDAKRKARAGPDAKT